jgi:hypothetical protein
MKIYRLGAAPKNGVGFGSTDLEYIQDGVNEAVASIVSAQLPEGYDLPVIMNGCVVTKVGTNYTHTAGQIYYQGFLYTVDALTVALASPSGEAKWGLLELPEPTDNPVVFDNGSSYNIDIHLKFILVASTETGIVQWDEIRRLEHIRFNKSRELYEIITIPKLPSVDFLTDNFTSGLGKPYTKYEGFALATGDNNTCDLAGIGTVGANFKNEALTNVRASGGTYSDSYWMLDIRNAIGNLVGKWKHKLTANQSGLRDHVHPISAYRLEGVDVDPTLEGDNSGESPRYRTYDSGGVSGGALDAIDDTDLRQPVKISIIIQKVSEITA